VLFGLIAENYGRWGGGGGVHHLCWYYWRNYNICNLYPHLYPLKIALGELIFNIIDSFSPKKWPFSLVRACSGFIWRVSEWRISESYSQEMMGLV